MQLRRQAPHSALRPAPTPLLEGGGSCAAGRVGFILARGGDDRCEEAGARRDVIMVGVHVGDDVQLLAIIIA